MKIDDDCPADGSYESYEMLHEADPCRRAYFLGISYGRANPRWRKIHEDESPKQGERVLWREKCGRVFEGALFEGFVEESFKAREPIMIEYLTHWTELPGGPSDG